jgi:hypothetical protein
MTVTDSMYIYRYNGAGLYIRYRHIPTSNTNTVYIAGGTMI